VSGGRRHPERITLSADVACSSWHRALSLDVLRIEGGKVAEITSFVDPELFAAFGLAKTL
jgi:hypothetical protein